LNNHSAFFYSVEPASLTLKRLAAIVTPTKKANFTISTTQTLKGINMRVKACLILIVACFLILGAQSSYAVVIEQGGVKIQVGRVLHGAKTGKQYLGYSGGTITMPHNNGGMLSFALWNDVQVNGWAHTNYFNGHIQGVQIKIPNYATRKQIVEEYREHPGQWGAAGIHRVTLSIPQGVSALRFDNQGSATGIEISDVRFVQGYRHLPGGYTMQAFREADSPLIQVNRILTGQKTNRKYYGYTNGSIFLPHLQGGFLSFKVWNDQRVPVSNTLNRINLTIGNKKESFVQYTTSLDLSENYKEHINQWGPAGGSIISIQLGAGISKIMFNNSGSATGIEISDVEFSQGAPLIIDFRETVNRTSRVLNTFSRVLNGSSSGKIFYGYTDGRLILPNTKGGLLTLTLWNDHKANAQQTNNIVNIRYGDKKQSFQLTTLMSDRREFYREHMNQWGPAGGKVISVAIPTGIATVDINNAGSQTGIELSDLSFRSN